MKVFHSYKALQHRKCAFPVSGTSFFGHFGQISRFSVTFLAKILYFLPFLLHPDSDVVSVLDAIIDREEESAESAHLSPASAPAASSQLSLLSKKEAWYQCECGKIPLEQGEHAAWNE